MCQVKTDSNTTKWHQVSTFHPNQQAYYPFKPLVQIETR